MSIGETIKKLREAQNLTQEQFAARLNVSRDLVSKWECDRRKPGFEMLSEIAAVLQTEAESLIDRDDLIYSELDQCIPGGMTADNALGLINTFLSGLDERECSIFLRRYYFFEDSKTIAARLGLSGGNVRTSLFRIRKKLKDYLRRCNNEQN